MEHKLSVLAKIAKQLNERNITWALGASGMLYFNGIIDRFHDLDILVDERHILEAKAVLDTLGTLQERIPHPDFKTKHFLEYVIEGVEVDTIAGFVIHKEGTDYAMPFDETHIEGTASLWGETIPLQSRSDWQHYYTLMGRPEKALMCTL